MEPAPGEQRAAGPCREAVDGPLVPRRGTGESIRRRRPARTAEWVIRRVESQNRERSQSLLPRDEASEGDDEYGRESQGQAFDDGQREHQQQARQRENDNSEKQSADHIDDRSEAGAQAEPAVRRNQDRGEGQSCGGARPCDGEEVNESRHMGGRTT